MFTIRTTRICNCCQEEAEKFKANSGNANPIFSSDSAAIVEPAITWWSNQLHAVNPDKTEKVDAFIEIMRSDLYVKAPSSSEKCPIYLEIDTGCCGAYDGSLAVYTAAVDTDITLPEGFEPGGHTMILTPNATMIVNSDWHDESSGLTEGWDTLTRSVIRHNESPVIHAVARWLIDYVWQYVSYDDPEMTEDNFDERTGDADLIYEQIVMRLRTAINTGTVTWSRNDLSEILPAANCPIPAPQITIKIEEQTASVSIGGNEVTIFKA